MEEDDYYLDSYDCPTNPRAPPISTRLSPPTTLSLSLDSGPASIMIVPNNSNNQLDQSAIISDTSSSTPTSPPTSLDPSFPSLNSSKNVANSGIIEPQYEYDDEVYYPTPVLPTPDNEPPIPGPQSNEDAETNTNTTAMEEYLHNIWSELQVGMDGFLTIDELYRVCEHIGMLNNTNSAEQSLALVEQLFDQLDNDGDGRVSFDEFMDGLFRFVHNNNNHTATSGLDMDTSDPSLPTSTSKQLNPPPNTTSTISFCEELSSSPPPLPTSTLSVKHRHYHSHGHHGQMRYSPSSLMTIKNNSLMMPCLNLLSTYTKFLSINHDKDG